MAQQSDVIARARALHELVRAEAPRTERQRTLTAPVVQALLDAELFYLMVPAALGGLEVDGRTYLEVVEALAAADGSTGWCVMIGAEVNGMAGVNLPADVARGMLFQHGPICCAGSAIPEGAVSIERTGDQYRVSGRWRFASGCQHESPQSLAAAALKHVKHGEAKGSGFPGSGSRGPHYVLACQYFGNGCALNIGRLAIAIIAYCAQNGFA